MLQYDWVLLGMLGYDWLLRWHAASWLALAGGFCIVIGRCCGMLHHDWLLLHHCRLVPAAAWTPYCACPEASPVPCCTKILLTCRQTRYGNQSMVNTHASRTHMMMMMCCILCFGRLIRFHCCSTWSYMLMNALCKPRCTPLVMIWSCTRFYFSGSSDQYHADVCNQFGLFFGSQCIGLSTRMVGFSCNDFGLFVGSWCIALSTRMVGLRCNDVGLFLGSRCIALSTRMVGLSYSWLSAELAHD